MTIPFARLPTVPDQRPRFRLSVEKYEHMIATGTLGAEDRVELIDGELVEKMPIGDLHAECVDWFVERFVRTFAGRARVRIQNPALMPHSVPEPDVQLLKLRPAGYRSATTQHHVGNTWLWRQHRTHAAAASHNKKRGRNNGNNNNMGDLALYCGTVWALSLSFFINIDDVTLIIPFTKL